MLNSRARPLHGLIIGAGIGGLTCAIVGAKWGIRYTILERAAEILPVGAGIQIPPNASRIMASLGLLPKLLKEGGIILDALNTRRYQDGSLLSRREAKESMVEKYGSPWILIHREDYHRVLLDEAIRLGVDIRLGAEVKEIGFSETSVRLSGGEVLTGDFIVGADGLWSATRDQLLGTQSPPSETGDLAYRCTFSLEELSTLRDTTIDEMCSKPENTMWIGPQGHSVFYPVKAGTQFNLVLLRPDNMPAGVRTENGDLQEMRDWYKGWDPVLTKIISCTKSVLKWKLCHHSELENWTKNNVVLLGDSCHPTLPYQAQGAAMAVEDAAVLGILLGNLSQVVSQTGASADASRAHIPALLRLYQSLRKSRTTTNVEGAVSNGQMFHLSDGPEQEARDAELEVAKWEPGKKSKWRWIDPEYQLDLMGYDCWTTAQQAFEAYWHNQVASQDSVGVLSSKM